MGLMLPLSRKSVEPMAARIDPLRVSARHQALHHFVAASRWSDEAVLQRVREWVTPLLGTDGGVYWIVDDKGFPKKGRHSVGVARQYCGQLGKQVNCQVAVSLSLASARGSVPIAWRLYLSKDWAEDLARRARAQVPPEVGFATKPRISPRVWGPMPMSRCIGVRASTTCCDRALPGCECESRTGTTGAARCVSQSGC